MSTKRNGLVSVYESTSATSGYTLISNECRRDSELPEEAINNELGNTVTQSGSTITPSIAFLEFSKYSDLKSRALAKTRRFYAFVMPDGTAWRTSEAVPISVIADINADRTSGDAAFMMTLELSDDEPWVPTTISSLT